MHAYIRCRDCFRSKERTQVRGYFLSWYQRDLNVPHDMVVSLGFPGYLLCRSRLDLLSSISLMNVDLHVVMYRGTKHLN